VTSHGLLDPEEARLRLGPLHARPRLGMELEHEAESGKRPSFLHQKNLPLTMIEAALRVTGTYWRGRANAGNVQLRRNLRRSTGRPGTPVLI
jgi:uncharacterized protein